MFSHGALDVSTSFNLSRDAVRFDYIEEDGALREGVRMGWWLRFDSSEKEYQYAIDLDRHNRRNIRNVIIIGFWSLVLDFVTDYMKGTVRMLEDDIAQRVAGLARVGQLILFVIDFVVSRQKRYNQGDMMVVMSALHSYFLFQGHPYRMCKIFSTNCERLTKTCGDTILIMCLMLINIGVHCSFISVRTSRSWVICFTQVLMFFGLSVGGLAPDGLAQTVFVGGCYAAASFCCWRGRYSEELRDRIRWSENRNLLIRLIAQQAEMERLQEFEMNVAAMEGPAADVQAGDSLCASTFKLSTSFGHQIAERRLEVDRPPNVRKGLSRQHSTAEACTVAAAPNPLLHACLAGRTTDGARVKRMAEQLRHRDYSLKDFFFDAVEAFPELELFFVNFEATGEHYSGHEREYQRTIGALFAVYWLFRLDGDGKQGFCYGVDVFNASSSQEAKWRVFKGHYPKDRPGTPFFQLSDDGKRSAFLSSMDWEAFAALRRLSGCDGNGKGDNGNERVVALLCLTAFHDIMKVTDLCPTVQAEHGYFHGYEPGAVIHDHDVALAYVLEKYPTLLPSFAILPECEQKSVIFTQGKMQFNHGWFVQAEGPPGAMLSAFKRAHAFARPGDLAFYFIHWFTDLAGAEPTPMGGAEKFVLKFPHSVLAAFLWSVPFLHRLEGETETNVVESYLLARWAMTFPDGPEPPHGREAVACLRLAAMAQAEAPTCMRAFHLLSAQDRDILAVEMARTGSSAQHFRLSSVTGGPAFLVYYGPALLQRCRHEDFDEMLHALQVLAEVYRAGRQLWPATVHGHAENVTLEIGQLKSMEVTHLSCCNADDARAVWALVVKNNKEAIVELVSADRLNSLNELGARYRALDLSPVPAKLRRTVNV